ncbi:MAG: hypothetical protein AB1Z66_10945 [Candidatus Limnocylindrales bacterium]
MSQRDPEYDRFGPWAVEISEEDPPPPLFRTHLTRPETPLLSVKIPRRIARREAHPGMDLYDYMVSLYEEDMVVLERVDREVGERTIRYRDLEYLSLRDELLRGTVHLGTADGHYDLPYNTVSGDLMRRLVDLLRARYLPAGEPLAVEMEPIETVELSFYFERLLRDELAGASGMQPVAAQADTPLGALEVNRWRRLLFGIVDKRLLESLHLSDGQELYVIDRGQTYAYRWQTTYGRRETWIPLRNISACDWDWGPDAVDAAPVTLTVTTRAGELRWVFTPNNATLGSYRRSLTSVSTATRH